MSRESSTADEQAAIQQALLVDCLPLVSETYATALRERVAVPVVFLLDCEDEIGGEIARAWRGDDAVDNALATETDDDDQQATTVLAVAHPFLQCAAEVPGVFPYLAASFKDPPPEGLLLAIVVAAGGAASYTVETG